jgi:hypothetical protein
LKIHQDPGHMLVSDLMNTPLAIMLMWVLVNRIFLVFEGQPQSFEGQPQLLEGQPQLFDGQILFERFLEFPGVSTLIDSQTVYKQENMR